MSEEEKGTEVQNEESGEQGSPKWTYQLPEDLRENEEFKQHEKLGDFARHYLETKEKMPKTPSDPKEYGLENGDLAKLAHENGWTVEQAKKAKEFYDNAVIGPMKQKQADADKKRQEAEAALKTEWGGDLEKNIGSIKRLLGDDVVKELKFNDTYGNSPALMKRLLYLSSVISEDAFTGGTPEGGLDDHEQLLRELYPTMYN